MILITSLIVTLWTISCFSNSLKIILSIITKIITIIIGLNYFIMDSSLSLVWINLIITVSATMLILTFYFFNKS